MATASSLLQQLTNKHNELIQLLETRYTNHINALLKQKTKLLFVMQQQYMEQVEKILELEKRQIGHKMNQITNNQLVTKLHTDVQVYSQNTLCMPPLEKEVQERMIICSTDSDDEPIMKAKRKKNNLSYANAEHIRSKKLNTSCPIILCSKLNEHQVKVWLQFTEVFGNHAIVTSKWRADVTHLVTTCTMKEDKRILQSRTLKYFQCLISGTFILCFEWIEQCLKQNAFINEDGYELLGDIVALGSPLLSRQLRMQQSDFRLFAKLYVFIEFFEDKTCDKIYSILLIGGCTNIERNCLPIYWLNKKEYYKKMTEKYQIVYAYQKLPKTFGDEEQQFCELFNVKMMSFNNIMDAVSRFKLLD